MDSKKKSLMELHLAVFLFGLSGLFGKFISLSPIIIVAGRVVFSSTFLFIIIHCFKKNMKLKEKKHYIFLLIMGLILAIHWTTFFKSIQVSTVAIGLLSFSTFPVFVTFLEPYFFKERIKGIDVLVALITFIGVIFVVPKFELGNNLTQGVLWGILSGFTYAVLGIFNRKYVKEYSSLVIAFYEQFVCAVILLPVFLVKRPIVTVKDIILMLLLGVVFTGISHTIFISSLKNIKTQIAGIISSLEPLYGIILAALLLGEIPTLRELFGGGIILGTVFYSTIKNK
ncbi:DMT family transporter [Hathewaya limosa]|uniref:Drug/metabolite transporter (DMT)-like permease n=1 Tax=Hathewaya limosa TaxID=1536 RepID=A0ABU0JUT0_HATLI|nr:DMT family transporter [Hathewaya limosa]MDQ0480859.1 drug/metabolite transporter (DMT)-like permease [Hathewaya limosa]